MIWDRKLNKERTEKAVKLVLEEGYTPAEAALRCGLYVKQLYGWVYRERCRRKNQNEKNIEYSDA